MVCLCPLDIHFLPHCWTSLSQKIDPHHLGQQLHWPGPKSGWQHQVCHHSTEIGITRHGSSTYKMPAVLPPKGLQLMLPRFPELQWLKRTSQLAFEFTSILTPLWSLSRSKREGHTLDKTRNNQWSNKKASVSWCTIQPLDQIFKSREGVGKK